MARFLRTTVGRLLLGFMILDVAIWTYVETAGSRLNAGTDITGQQLAWTALDLFLVWRTWRGGRIAWGILIATTVIPMAQLFFGLGSLTAYAAGMWVLILAQLFLLLAPAVRRHVRRGHQVTAS